MCPCQIHRVEFRSALPSCAFPRPSSGHDGRPADAAHVREQLGSSLDRVTSGGEVGVAGRPFRPRRSSGEDAEAQHLEATIRTLGRAPLVMHAPRDEM
jgi:hypothetical protein